MPPGNVVNRLKAAGHAHRHKDAGLARRFSGLGVDQSWGIKSCLSLHCVLLSRHAEYRRDVSERVETSLSVAGQVSDRSACRSATDREPAPSAIIAVEILS